MSFSRQHTSEPANVALGSADPVAVVSPSPLEFEDVAPRGTDASTGIAE